MTDTSPSPDNARIREVREFDDPHYHDEDDEISNEEKPRKPSTTATNRKEITRWLSPRRRYED